MRTFLGTADAFFDGIGEVGLACANVGTKDVRSVTCMTLSFVGEINVVKERQTFVVDAKCQLFALV